MSAQPYMNGAAPGLILERVRYYPRQLVDANTLTTDQEYERQKAQQHNRLLHGWGVVCGLEVKATATKDNPWLVTVCPGYALSPQGDAIDVQTAIEFDLATGVQTTQDPCAGVQPCPPVGPISGDAEENAVYLAARYMECYGRPERVPPVGCGCDETACEYARIRDSFELKLLFELPESHRRAAEADAAWCGQIKRWAQAEDPGPAPAPPCPECYDDPWVVMARIRLPGKADTAIDQPSIGYQWRRVLRSVSALQTLVRCT